MNGARRGRYGGASLPLDPRFYNEETGMLRDYIPRAGDPAPPGASAHSAGQRGRRWGNVKLLSRLSEDKFVTFVNTGDLGRVYPLNVQLKFAAPDANGGPTLPWSGRYTNLSGVVEVRIIRSADPDSAPIQETFTIDGSLAHPPFVGGTIPFDTIMARNLTVSARTVGASIQDTWAEVIASEVEDVATRAKVIGYPVQRTKFYAASAALQQFLIAQPARASFIICNTSATATLLIGFDPATSWAGPLGAFVLPANQFAQYEAPIGGWRGDVFGIWTGALAGGALVTEGLYF